MRILTFSKTTMGPGTVQVKGFRTNGEREHVSKETLLSIAIQEFIPVLIVSSRPDDHTMLTLYLQSLNCELHHAFTCAEGAGILGLCPITVVLSEQLLPDGNWMQLQWVGCSADAAPEFIVLPESGGVCSDSPPVGASDVLCRPFEETLAAGAVALGYLRWSGRHTRALRAASKEGS